MRRRFPGVESHFEICVHGQHPLDGRTVFMAGGANKAFLANPTQFLAHNILIVSIQKWVGGPDGGDEK
jgi:hypothetical protein